MPEKFRAEIGAQAAAIRARHRVRNARLQQLVYLPLKDYSIRIKDNIDLDRIADVTEKARLVGNALIERGDARAFAFGRKLLKYAEA